MPKQALPNKKKLEINGVFGLETQTAVKTYQKIEQDKATGIVGPATRPKLWKRMLLQVPEFLHRTKLTYPELLQLLQTRFVNPGPLAGVIVIHSPVNNPCDLSSAKLQYLNGSELRNDTLNKIHRFIRLWRKLGWTMPELDKTFTALNYSNINPNFLWKLAQVQWLKTELKIPLVNLLSLWADIDIQGNDSLYHTLFLNKAAQIIDPAFYTKFKDLLVFWWKWYLKMQAEQSSKPGTLNFWFVSWFACIVCHLLYWKATLTDQKFPVPDIRETLTNHSNTLQSAFRISAADLNLIRRDCGLQQDKVKLTLENISKVYRYVVLAKALELPISDFIALKQLLRINPFIKRQPYHTWLFVELARAIQASNFSIAQLTYLYRHASQQAASLAPKPEILLPLVKTLREGLTQIVNEHQLFPDPNGEVTKTKLDLIFEPEIGEQLVQMLGGSISYTTQLKRLPSKFSFPKAWEDKISYDSEQKTLHYTGAMTTTERSQLNQLSNSKNYQAAIQNLYQQPRDFLENVFGDFLCLSESTEPETLSDFQAKLLDSPSRDLLGKEILLDEEDIAVLTRMRYSSSEK